MAFQQDRQPTWLEQTSGELQRLCLQPTNIDPETRQKGVIPDRSFETIAECLRDLGYDNYADRPRHYAVLSMMNRVDLLPAFEIAGLLDNSFPYPEVSPTINEQRSRSLSSIFGASSSCYVSSLSNGEGHSQPSRVCRVW